jgi:uncharacterized 2Fe-2S/4Fe-4S cluster protein (DUF4445 family)
MSDKKIKNIKINLEPIGKRIELDLPENALKAILDAGIGIKSVCGGKGSCGKCRIIILDNAAGPANEPELKSLGREEINFGVRLACQQKFDRDLNVYIPASSLTEEQKLQVSGAEAEIEVEPVVNKYYLEIDSPSLSDMRPDLTRIKDTLHKDKNIAVRNIDKNVLETMPEILRKSSWKVTVAVRDGEIISVEAGDTAEKSYGVAVDLGTTKIAVLLVDLITGKNIDKKGIMNPQISFGEDVMSRINFAMQDDSGKMKMQKIVVEHINKTIEDLAAKNNISCDQIIELTLVGNTAMHHLFLGLPVRQLGLSPFVAVSGDVIEFKARNLGLNISPGAYIYLLPSVAGFIGSDHIAMILASSVNKVAGNNIGIDIGTNTEIVLKSRKGMESVSTASGPAFEGAHIKYGMRAAPGAIERVIIDRDSCVPKIQTINDKPPAGICGSGILDAIAELLKTGIIDRRGKFNPQSGCLCRDDKGNYQYLLDPNAYSKDSLSSGCSCNKKHKEEDTQDKINPEHYSDKRTGLCPCAEGVVAINQKDIVEIQLAKSAIRTGINVLLESAGIDFNLIDNVIIAGAFGSYIDPKNVVDIGMFPRIDLKKIIQVGNAAAVGAKMVLVSKRLRSEGEKIASELNYLELTVFPTFTDNFVKSTLFPET